MKFQVLTDSQVYLGLGASTLTCSDLSHSLQFGVFVLFGEFLSQPRAFCIVLKMFTWRIAVHL